MYERYRRPDFQQNTVSYRLTWFAVDVARWICLVDVCSHPDVYLYDCQLDVGVIPLPDWANLPQNTTFEKVPGDMVPAAIRVAVRAKVAAIVDGMPKRVN